MLSFTLLGQVTLSKDGIALRKFRSQKEAALLIYLAQTGQTHQREFIAELLWEANSTKQALSNLRTLLTRLRKKVGDALLVTRKTIALTPENRQRVDSVILLDAISQSSQLDSPGQAHKLQEALDSYQGDFLAQFQLPNAPRFTDWYVTVREHIRREVLDAYNRLGQYARTTGAIEYGVDVTRRWLQVDALDENANQLLIQFLLEAGNSREALAHYDNYATLLKMELGIEPSGALTALVSDTRPQPAPLTPYATAVRHNLPPTYDQFFGRKSVQQEIHTRLDQPWCRLVTLTGQGGVGKTRLAITIARSRLGQYRDGVWLIELADLDPDDDDLVESIAVEIAIILDMRLTSAGTPIEQLLKHLKHKQMLFIFDNFEHVLAGMQIVLDIIQQCERVQMLVTSREALRIRAEWTIVLSGLAFPMNDAVKDASDAEELFVARRAQQHWQAISEEELIAIRAICRKVEGLPLAIELAAALTRHIPSQMIVERLETSFDALTIPLYDLPERHRGLRVVFEMSWQTLTPGLQQRLGRLAVFRGGFTARAAQQIAEANIQHLSALGEKSLLTHHVASGRYTLHPVIREYSAKQRVAADQTRHKHTDYYLSLLAQHTEPLQKDKPQESVKLLEPDIDNIRLAWQSGLANRLVDKLLSALTSLSTYYQLRGLAREGEATMQETAKSADTWGENGLALATRAGLEQARFQNRLGRHRPAIQTIETVLELAMQGDDHWANGMARVWWGEALWRLGNHNLAKDKLGFALKTAHSLGASSIIGWSHHQLGIIHDIQSDYDVAQQHLQKATSVWRSLNNAHALSNSLNSIGVVFYHQGDLDNAYRTMEQTLKLCEQMENRHLQSSLLNNLSIISTEREDFSGAQYYLSLGLNLAMSSGDLVSQGQIYTNLGRNHRMLGELNLAATSLEEALRLSRLVGKRSLEAIALLNLAETMKDLDRLVQAELFYKQALDLSRQDGLQRTECGALIGLAEVLSEIDRQRALQTSTEAVKLAKDLNNTSLYERAELINTSLHSS